MNKIILAFVCGAAIFFESCSGCKENVPPVKIDNANFVAQGDTSYIVTTVPAVQLHNVLVEEFTGQSCSNCPAAHDALKAEVVKSGGHVNVLGLYYFGSLQSNPVKGYVHDLRDSMALQINQLIYGGDLTLPGGGVDRVSVGGTRFLGQSSWGGEIAKRLAVPSDMNIDIATRANVADSLDTIIVKVTYTKAVSDTHYLSVAILEDSIVDKQEKGSTHVDDYDFENVFRGLVTPVPNGVELKDSAKVAGRVFQKVFVYRPKKIIPRIIQKNCRVVAFVHGAPPPIGDYRIHQSMQAPLRP